MGHRNFRCWRLPTQLPCSADIIYFDALVRWTSDFSVMMAIIGGVGLSSGTEISNWIQIAQYIHPVLRRRALQSRGHQIIRWATGTFGGTENPISSLHLSNSSQQLFGHSKYISFFFPNLVLFVIFITVYSFIIAKRTQALQYSTFIGCSCSFSENIWN